MAENKQFGISEQLDTISRRFVIKEIDELLQTAKGESEHDLKMLRRVIKDMLPSAQRWIPVVEGLPDKYEYVLLTCERNGNLVTDFGCLSPCIDGDISWWIAAHDLIEGWRVLAWLPLPSPWKGGEE